MKQFANMGDYIDQSSLAKKFMVASVFQALNYMDFRKILSELRNAASFDIVRICCRPAGSW